MRKRLLSLFCALSLLLTLLPTSAFAVGDGDKEAAPQTEDTEAVEPAPEELELTVPQVWEEFTVTPVTSLPDDDFPALYDDRAATATWNKNFGDQLTTLLPEKLHTDINKTQGEFAKELYTALCNNVDALKAGEPVSITLEKTNPYLANSADWKKEYNALNSHYEEYKDTYGSIATNAIAAFDRDHSDIFWLGQARTGVSNMVNNKPVTDGYRFQENDVYSYQLSVTFDISNSWTGTGGRGIDQDMSTVTDAVTKRVTEANEKTSTYEKLLTVHDWLTKNNAYNEAAANGGPNHADRTPWEAISALTSDETLQPVCEGYARAFKLICDQMNIPCVLVSGTVNSGAHMWNYVQMENGKWYAVDVTWDDPVGGSSTGNVSNSERHDYFLVGSNTKVDGATTFDGNHNATSNDFLTDGHAKFAYPDLSAEKYEKPATITIESTYEGWSFDFAYTGSPITAGKKGTSGSPYLIYTCSDDTVTSFTVEWQKKGENGQYSKITDAAVTGENGPKDVGAYKLVVTATKDDQTVATGTREFKILPHDFKYTDAPITVSLTDAEKLTYDGKEKTVTVSVTHQVAPTTAKTLAVGTDYTVEVTGETSNVSDNTVKATDAGTYTVTVKGKGNFEGEKTEHFTIAKATHNNETTTGFAKFGTEGTVDLSSLIAEGGKAAIEGNPTDNDSVLYGNPTVVDGKTLKFQFKNDANLKGKKAEVVVKVIDAKNYNEYTITVTLKVTEKKAQTPLKFTNAVTTVTYGQTLQLTLEGGSGDGAVTYNTTDIGGTVTVDEKGRLTATRTGDVRIVATKDGKEMYENTTATLDITVTKAPLAIKVLDKQIYVGDAVPDLKNPQVGTHYTVTGLVKAEDLKSPAVMKYQQNGSEVKPDTSKPGSYVITLTGLTTATPNGPNRTYDNYERKIEFGKLTILAKPSSGGSSSGGSSSSGGGSSSSGGGGGSSSSDRDNSTTTGKTDTTTRPDGTKIQTETKADGTKIQTVTNKDGSVTKTTTNPNGSSVTEAKAADGSTGTVKTDKNGQTTAETALSNKAIETAKRNGEPVKAPVEVKATRNSNTAPTVKVELPQNSGDTKVEIPVSNVKPGTVAVIVHPDGTEEIVKNSVPTEDGIQLTVNGGATVKIVDNSKDFIDTRNHWAKDAIDFVSARGLVNGMSATRYAPDATATRAQLWTILARQNDTDLSGGANWYEKAQLWSKDKGISDGANPNGTIDRAQMVTMLWRAMGQPAAASGASFADVPADSYYAQAVAWAIENDITTGVGGGRFDPNSTCTRGQIATFLYRYMK